MFVFLSQPCPAGKDPAPAFAMPPVIWYGTSIQQGGVASRAGTAYDAVISRALEVRCELHNT